MRRATVYPCDKGAWSLKMTLGCPIPLALLVLMSGCATMPDGVLLVSEEHVADCTPIGMVSNDAFHDMTIANATADMLQSAKRIGADTVVLTTKPAAKMLEISMVGTAYKCGS